MPQKSDGWAKKVAAVGGATVAVVLTAGAIVAGAGVGGVDGGALLKICWEWVADKSGKNIRGRAYKAVRTPRYFKT